MKITVCVKHVPDSAAAVRVRDTNRIDESITFLLNPYDEHAVTAALDLRDQIADTEVVAVCLARGNAEKTLRSALAMGADRGILIDAAGDPDSMVTARALHAAIARDGVPDLILTGKESIDVEGMQTMFRLAAHFDMPAATNVVDLRITGGRAVVACEKEAGAREVLELTLPCVLAAAKGLNTPRYPTLPQIVQSRKKPVTRHALGELDIMPAAGGTTLTALRPAVETRHPRQLTGTPQEAVEQLVGVLREAAMVP